LRPLIFRLPDISDCFDKIYFKEIFMKKFLSVLLLVFAIGSVFVGCQQCNQPDNQPPITDDNPADSDAGKAPDVVK
jgi:hypothetical protein